MSLRRREPRQLDGLLDKYVEVIKTADWVIDLGPESGDGGGEIVAWGPARRYRQGAAELYRQVSGTGAGESGRRQEEAQRGERGGGVIIYVWAAENCS
jgi:hypothetical protein